MLLMIELDATYKAIEFCPSLLMLLRKSNPLRITSRNQVLYCTQCLGTHPGHTETHPGPSAGQELSRAVPSGFIQV